MRNPRSVQPAPTTAPSRFSRCRARAPGLRRGATCSRSRACRSGRDGRGRGDVEPLVRKRGAALDEGPAELEHRVAHAWMRAHRADQRLRRPLPSDSPRNGSRAASRSRQAAVAKFSSPRERSARVLRRWSPASRRGGATGAARRGGGSAPSRARRPAPAPYADSFSWMAIANRPSSCSLPSKIRSRRSSWRCTGCAAVGTSHTASVSVAQSNWATASRCESRRRRPSSCAAAPDRRATYRAVDEAPDDVAAALTLRGRRRLEGDHRLTRRDRLDDAAARIDARLEAHLVDDAGALHFRTDRREAALADVDQLADHRPHAVVRGGDGHGQRPGVQWMAGLLEPHRGAVRAGTCRCPKPPAASGRPATRRRGPRRRGGRA